MENKESEESKNNQENEENQESMSYTSESYTEGEESETEEDFEDMNKWNQLLEYGNMGKSYFEESKNDQSVSYMRENSYIAGDNQITLFRDNQKIERMEQTVVQNSCTIRQIFIRKINSAWSSSESSGEWTPVSYISNKMFGGMNNSKNFDNDNGITDEGIVKLSKSYLEPGKFMRLKFYR